MKKILTVITLFSIFSISQGAEWATDEGSCFQKGDMNGSVGLSMFYFGFYGTFDYAVHEAISAGGGLGFNTFKYSSWARHNHFPIVARALFHPFNLSVLADKVSIRNKLDVYVGFSLGWDIGWWKYDGVGSVASDKDDIGGFIIRENIGARFYFAPTFYAFVEEGAGFGWINGGVGMKF